MKTINVYEAEDGKRFDSYYACLEYERSLVKNKYKELADYIQFYGYHGDPLTIEEVATGRTPYYVVVSHIEEMPEHIAEQWWVEVVPSELDDLICNHENGVYVRCENEIDWEYWDIYRKEYLLRQTVINKIMEVKE